MIEVEAIRNCMYAGNRYKAGDRFGIASNRDFKICVAAKLVKPAPAVISAPKNWPKPPAYVAKVVAPVVTDDDPTFIPVEVDEDKPKRAYKRRDMKAED